MTDLSRFDTRQKAEEGVTADLVIDGETIYGDDDQPVTFTLKGMHDQAVHTLILKAQGQQHRTPKEVFEADMKLARAAVIGWSGNFSVEGEKHPFSRANIEIVLTNPEVRSAVLAVVFDRHRFMNGS